MSTRVWFSFGATGAFALFAALTLPACDGGTAGPGEVDTTGAVVGELETYVADYDDGTSERQHYLVLGDRANTRLRLIFDGEPALSSTTRIRVWGSGDPNQFRVTRYEPVMVPRADLTTVSSALIGAPSRTRTAAFVLVDLGGGVNVTAAAAQPLVFGKNFADVYDQMSYGQLKFTGDIIGPLPYTMTACANSDTSLLASTLKAMIPTKYDHYMWYLGQRSTVCTWGGIGAEGNATTPRNDSWFNASTGCTVLVQEVGHNLGMMHSSTIACAGASFADDPTAAGCTGNEYGNRYTPMGSGCGHLNSHDKWYERFFGGCNAVKVTSSGMYNLMPLETSCNGIQAIQIPMPTATRTFKPTQSNTPVPLKFYYLEFRGPWGLDTAVRTPTVMVLAGDDIHAANRTSTWSWLLDMNPTTTNAFDGLTVGQTFSDPAGGVSITLVAADTTKATVMVDITGGTGAPTCMDGTTTLAPGPADCGTGAVIVGTGGAGGGTGPAGTGGARGTGGATATGTGGARATGGTTGTGGAPAGSGGQGVVVGTGGAPGAAGSTVVSGTGGSSGPVGPGTGTDGGGKLTGNEVSGGCACSSLPSGRQGRSNFRSTLGSIAMLGGLATLQILRRRRRRPTAG